MSAKTQTIQNFKGLNNVADPLGLGLQWLTVADNIDIDSDGSVQRRDGYARVLTGKPSGAYATLDLKRTYMVVDGTLVRLHDDLSRVPLKTGLSPAPTYFTEVNGAVYFSNGPDKGIIGIDDVVRPWSWLVPDTPRLAAIAGSLPAGTYQVACTYVYPDGRETGAGAAAAVHVAAHSALQITGIPQLAGCTTMVYIAPANSDVFGFAFATAKSAETWSAGADALGMELPTQFDGPPPAGAVVPMFHNGRMFLMQYFPQSDTTAVWFSQPLAFHLFDQASGFVQVKGQGVLLAPTDDGLIIATKQAIYSWDGAALSLLADYGCVSPHGWAIDDEYEVGNQRRNATYLWTTRGVCRAFPFANLTAGNISVSSGASAGAAVVKKNGQKRFVVALRQGGSAFNQRGS